MRDQGRVVDVTTHTLGDELAADAGVGATTLTVYDSVDFPEDGGRLLLKDVSYAYTSVDDETDVITLDGTVTIAAVTGDPVVLDPPSVETWAQVEAGEGDPIMALVPHPLLPLLAEGARDSTEGETVEVELKGDVWVVADVFGSEPVMADGSVGVGTFRDSVVDAVGVRFKRGEEMLNTNATGDITFAHGLGVVPTVVMLTPLSPFGFYRILGAPTATNITVRVINTSAATPATGTTVNLYWVAFE